MIEPLHLLAGSLLLSLVHAAIPNHWIPMVILGRTENWPRNETLGITAVAGFAHTMSTILIGIGVGLIGYRLSSTHEFLTRVAAPLILISLGVVLFWLDLKGSHSHGGDHLDADRSSKRSKLAIVVSLSVAMFFSPCLEIEAYFFTAGTGGWAGIALVSIVYLVVTILGMVVLVYLGLKGIERIRWHFLEHHERMVSGLILIFLGIVAYFMRI